MKVKSSPRGKRCRSLALQFSLMLFGAILVQAQTPPDLAETFENGTGLWRSSTNTAVLSFAATGGAPGGYLRGTGPAGTTPWHLLSPTGWAGDWSAYKVLKFDLSIPSRHYPDAGQAGMVVIVGANGQKIAWYGSTPLWTWTHYEVSLNATAFNVSEAVFTSVMTNVLELQILAEFSSSAEIVGLDNVLVTATPPAAHGTDLVCRFTDGTLQGWRPVDDVTLSVVDEGRPSFALQGDDWMDGRYWKTATPVSWAGDWRIYQELAFDMHWTGEAASHASVELLRIFGANGHTLTYSNSLTRGVWTHRSIPLTPESFGVSASELESVLAHVSEMWIFGEFGGSDDITMLDNISLLAAPRVPVQHNQNLVARFDAGPEGWRGYDLATVTWAATNGISGGGLLSVDAGSGWARFQSPDSWMGDWRAFRALRFMLRQDGAQEASYGAQVWIANAQGSNITVALPYALRSWTPFTVDLTPEVFGVTSNAFDTIMRDVACLWINADLVGVSGTGDSTRLDDVMLLMESEAGLPPDHVNDFDTGRQDWRYGEWIDSSGKWTFSGPAPHVATGGNPGGFLQNTDTGDWTYWFTPEAWAGDWRGLESVSFDFKVIQGAAPDLFGTRMLSIISPWGTLHADVSQLPVPGAWQHYEIPLNAAAFGVSQDVLNKALRDAAMLGIRSEWIYGAETEGLDNFRLSKAPDAYWDWIGNYYSGADLVDETKTGKTADPDDDRMSNWEEFIAGTTPTNQVDCLRLEVLAVTNGTCAIGFNTSVGRLYTLKHTPNPAVPGLWQPVGPDVTGNGAQKVTLDSTAVGPRFYRLEVRKAE